MNGARLDLAIPRGADWSMRFQWTDEDLVPVFVQAPCYLEIRVSPDDTSARVARLVTSGMPVADGTITIGSSPDYYIDVFLSRTKTILLDVGNYYYDLFVTNSNGYRAPLLRGGVEVVRNISRETT